MGWPASRSGQWSSSSPVSTSWGRRAHAPRWAQGIAYLLAGVGCAAAVFGVVAATTQRNNRFLAGGLTTLAAVAAALGGVLLAPALARLIAGRRAQPRPPPQLVPAAALLVPVVILGFGLLVFICFRQTRAGVSGATFVRLVFWTAVPAALLPVAIAAIATVRLTIGWRRAVPLALIVHGGLAVAGLAVAWNDHLRFAPWTDILVCAAGVGLAALLLARWRDRAAAGARPGRGRRPGDCGRRGPGPVSRRRDRSGAQGRQRARGPGRARAGGGPLAAGLRPRSLRARPGGQRL